MFCHNCGRQIQDDSKWCRYCGAQQREPVDPGAAPAREYAPRYTAAPAQTQKKSGSRGRSMLISILIFFAAALIGKFVIAPSMQSSSPKDSGKPSLSDLAVPTIDPQPEAQNGDIADGSGSNPAYTAIFSSNGQYVIHLPVMFGMDMACFARADEAGSIYCIDYGYLEDTILTWVETDYFNVAGYSEEDIREITEIAEEEAAQYSGYSCVNVTYSYSPENGRFMLKYEFTGMDQPENYRQLYDLGLADGEGEISASLSEQGLLAEGYVKR